MENINELSNQLKKYWILMISQGLHMAYAVFTLEEAHNAVSNASYYEIMDLDTGKIIELKNNKSTTLSQKL